MPTIEDIEVEAQRAKEAAEASNVLSAFAPRADTDANPTAAAPAGKAAKPKKETTSVNFATFQAKLSTPAEVAQHIVSLQKIRAKDLPPKLALFLQALSGKPELVRDLLLQFPAHVAVLMEKLCDSHRTPSSNAAESFDAYKAEFVIRLEANNAARSSFAKKVAAAFASLKEPEATELRVPLFTVGEMMTTLLASHSVAIVERRIQIATSIEELAVVSGILVGSVTPQQSGGDSAAAAAATTSSASEVLSREQASLSMVHLVSKLRRLIKPDVAISKEQSAAVEQIVRDCHFVFMESTAKSVVPNKVVVVISQLAANPQLVGAAHLSTFVANLKRGLESSTHDKVGQMTEVARIKECKTLEDLDGVVDTLTNDDGSLRLCSPDVLSSLAVAATNLQESDEGAQLMKERVLLLLQAVGVSKLPRRAKAFVDKMVRPKRSRGPDLVDAPADE